MKHLSKSIRAIHFMVLAFLMTLSSQANADAYKVGDTFYCSSEDGAFAQASGDWKVTRWNKLNFKFQFQDNETIVFGTEGYFGNYHFKGYSYQDSKKLVFRRNDSVFTLTDGHFTFGQASSQTSGFLTGNCDKF